MQQLDVAHLRVSVNDQLRVGAVYPDQNHLLLIHVVLMPGSYQGVRDAVGEPLSARQDLVSCENYGRRIQVNTSCEHEHLCR